MRVCAHVHVSTHAHTHMLMHGAQMEVKGLPWGVSSLPLLRDEGIKLGPTGLYNMSFCFLGHLASPNLCHFFVNYTQIKLAYI